MDARSGDYYGVSPKAEGWYSVTECPPPEGMLVVVRNNNGARLKHSGGLWFVPDGSMYVYYTPAWWRPLPEDYPLDIEDVS